MTTGAVVSVRRKGTEEVRVRKVEGEKEITTGSFGGMVRSESEEKSWGRRENTNFKVLFSPAGGLREDDAGKGKTDKKPRRRQRQERAFKGDVYPSGKSELCHAEGSLGTGKNQGRGDRGKLPSSTP